MINVNEFEKKKETFKEAMKEYHEEKITHEEFNKISYEFWDYVLKNNLVGFIIPEDSPWHPNYKPVNPFADAAYGEDIENDEDFITEESSEFMKKMFNYIYYEIGYKISRDTITIVPIGYKREKYKTIISEFIPSYIIKYEIKYVKHMKTMYGEEDYIQTPVYNKLRLHLTGTGVDIDGDNLILISPNNPPRDIYINLKSIHMDELNGSSLLQLPGFNNVDYRPARIKKDVIDVTDVNTAKLLNILLDSGKYRLVKGFTASDYFVN